MARRLRMYNAACEVRVKNEVLQVSNKAECFMLATEVHRPYGPNADAGRSGVRASQLSHVLLDGSFTNTLKDKIILSIMANILLAACSFIGKTDWNNMSLG